MNGKSDKALRTKLVELLEGSEKTLVTYLLSSRISRVEGLFLKIDEEYLLIRQAPCDMLSDKMILPNEALEIIKVQL